MKKIYAKLNPKVQNFTSSGGRSADAITPEMLAGAMAYIKNPLGALLLRVKYAGHTSGIKPLVDGFAQHLKQCFSEHGWRYKSIVTVERLAAVAVLEYIEGRCKHCNGRGVVYHNAMNGDGRVQQTCPKCDGSCAYQVKKSDRYKPMEISSTSYESTWHERFEFALRELSKLEGFSNKQVADALK